MRDASSGDSVSSSPPSAGNPPLANPYGDANLTAPIMPLQQLVAEILFVRTSYVKKIIEDCSNSEETIKLLRFCCWENPQFSSTVLSELLWQVRTPLALAQPPSNGKVGASGSGESLWAGGVGLGGESILGL